MAIKDKIIFPISLRAFWGKKDTQTGKLLIEESEHIPAHVVEFIDPTHPGLCEEFLAALRGDIVPDNDNFAPAQELEPVPLKQAKQTIH